MEEEDDVGVEAGTEGNLEDLDDEDLEFDGQEYDDEYSVYSTGKAKKGIYFQAEPLTRKQRYILRQQIPLMVGRTANFNIGKCHKFQLFLTALVHHFFFSILITLVIAD
jgi:hypothetical protein